MPRSATPRVFLEQAVVRPRHIEVQILADATGHTVHLFERDCSVQRRHQKVIEIAPAPNISDELRDALHRDAVAFAESIGYVNAGTVEFLVDTAGERAGEHVFIEMNPRIQVEHTVTEEVTDVDLVQSQIRIAAGETLDDLGLDQGSIVLRGAALQCRITTEDPSQGFRPDTGRITTYRSPGGAGIRLDGGTTAAGSQISPHFDSMLAKLTCRGRDFPAAVARAKRALAEFRIRGVSTNIPFLRAVLDDPAFVAGDLSTAFIEERPGLLTSHPSRDRATKLINWLADVTVNRPYGEKPLSISPGSKLPAIDLSTPAAGRHTRPPPRTRPGRVRACAARAGAARGHRDDVSRRASVAAGHSGAHARPGACRTARGAHDARAAVGRGMGRGDVRRRAPLPRGRSVGASCRRARGHPQHPDPDAAARPQHRRLHAAAGRGR